MSAVGLQPVHSVQLEVLGPVELAQRGADTVQVCPWLLDAARMHLCKASVSWRSMTWLSMVHLRRM